VVCRHLVWTLTDPESALRDWARVLKPGGVLVVFDGDFVNQPWQGRLAKRGMTLLGRWSKATPHRDPSLNAEHASILDQLYFREGLAFETLRDMVQNAGFTAINRGSYRAIARAQRRIAGPQDWLRTWLHRRFILSAIRT